MTYPLGFRGDALEAPDQHVLFRNSRFVNNTGTGESFGGALTLRVDASIISCHFEGNRARQGGAIYVPTGVSSARGQAWPC